MQGPAASFGLGSTKTAKTIDDLIRHYPFPDLQRPLSCPGRATRNLASVFEAAAVAREVEDGDVRVMETDVCVKRGSYGS